MDTPPITTVAPIDPASFRPSATRPLRAKARHLAASTRIEPHAHPWAQVAYSMTGVLRVTAGRSTFIVPPSRAVWIPPDVVHVVTVVEDADIRTLYLHQSRTRLGPGPGRDAAWAECRVLDVSPLLRELVLHLPTEPGTGRPGARERHLCALILDELAAAPALRLGVDLPQDKRLRALCEAVLDDPARQATLEEWSRSVGASPRTAARLFRAELGTTFGQWRQQVLLAKALSMAARRASMARIASELGYASPSAFSAMVRRSVGLAPSRLFAR